MLLLNENPSVFHKFYTHKFDNNSAKKSDRIWRIPGFAAFKAFAFPFVVWPTFFLLRVDKQDIKI